MRFGRLRPALILTAAVASLAAPAFAETPYDGLWNVTLVTRTGSCEPQKAASINVVDGSFQNGEVSGKVTRDGRVKASMGPAYASGQLDGKSGSGKWNGASGGVPCSGTWVASRQ